MINEFIEKYSGVPNVGNTPENKGQCVGLVSVFMDQFNIPHVWGHAKDIYYNAPDTHFQKIENSPNEYPRAGDIMCYDARWGGGYGHIGIIRSSNPDSDSYEIFEQNLPLNSPPVLATRDNWNGVIGWLRIRGYSEDPDTCKEIREDRDYQLKEKEKYKEEARNSRELIDKYQDEIKQKTETISKQQEQIAQLNEQLTNNTKEISDIRLENKTLRDDSRALQDTNNALVEVNNKLIADAGHLEKELSDLKSKYKAKLNKLPRWDLVKAVFRL